MAKVITNLTHKSPGIRACHGTGEKVGLRGFRLLEFSKKPLFFRDIYCSIYG